MLSRPVTGPRPKGLITRWRSDRRGATAVEFAFVAAPFFLLVLGVVTTGMHYFTMSSLEHGVEMAARKIRTGEAQKGNMTNAGFRQLVCDESGSYINCNANLVVHVKSGATFAALDPPTPCVTNGTLTGSGGASADLLANQSGGATATVLVTACYQWDLGSSLWQGIWNMFTVGPWAQAGASATAAGKTILQATTTFRTEPYQ